MGTPSRAFAPLGLRGDAFVARPGRVVSPGPFLRLGGRLSQGGAQDRGLGHSFLLGIATGFLWAPCAGPILGLILTGAALHGAHASTSLLLLAYALGAATSLAAALLVGGRLLGAMKRYLGADLWVRRILGAAVLFGVLLIALGWDRGLLTVSRKCRRNPWSGGSSSSFNRQIKVPSPATKVRRIRSGCLAARSLGSTRLPSPPRRCAARWCSSIFGPTPASTACGHSLCERLGRQVQGQRARGHRRAHAGVRI